MKKINLLFLVMCVFPAFVTGQSPNENFTMTVIPKMPLSAAALDTVIQASQSGVLNLNFEVSEGHYSAALSGRCLFSGKDRGIWLC